MSTSVPVSIDRIIGTVLVEATDGTERPASNGSKLKPGETVFLRKNSACRLSGTGFTIAHLLNTKGQGKTCVHIQHPLARHAHKSKHRLKGSVLRLGNKLAIEAQREGQAGILRFSAIIRL